MRGGQEGYDRAVTLFSPDGAIYQVQYAKRAVERGTAALGLSYPGGFVLISDGGPTNPLHERRADKVLAIDEHLGCATSGLVGDARALVDRLRREAQKERINYGSRLGAAEAVRRMSQYLQSYTQTGGVRPFGVSLLVGDASGEEGILLLNPAGASAEMRAAAIGSGGHEMSEALRERIDDAKDLESAVSLGLEVIDESVGGGLSGRLVEIGVGENGSFEVMSGERVREYVEEHLGPPS